MTLACAYFVVLEELFSSLPFISYITCVVVWDICISMRVLSMIFELGCHVLAELK